MAQVGSRGERLDLLVRQGTTLGPYICTLTNPDGSPFDLTSCTIEGQIRKNASDVGAPIAQFSVVFIDSLLGKYSFELSASVTSEIIAGEFQKEESSQYQWDMRLTDSLGRVIPLFYGTFENYRSVTHA